MKTLADSDEDDDAGKWIEKSRKLQQEKAEAAAREKALLEMESELGRVFWGMNSSPTLLLET